MIAVPGENVLNVIYSSGHRAYIGIGEGHKWYRREGIEEFHGELAAITKALSEWMADKSVEAGEAELGGYFKVKGGWFGTYEDLKCGASKFYLLDDLQHLIKQQEDE
jgi:hypothetical protein